MQPLPYKDAVTHRVSTGVFMSKEDYLKGAKESLANALKFLAIEAPETPEKKAVDDAIAEMGDVVENMFFKAFKLDGDLLGDDDAPKNLSDIRSHSGGL